MDKQQAADLAERRRELSRRLKSPLQNGTAYDYTNDDVDDCVEIIADLVAMIDSSRDFGAILANVQSMVLRLNQVNSRCHGYLIEWEQREQICEIINRAARYANVGEFTRDLTEGWRNW